METTARKRFTSEYAYNYIPEEQPQRVRRTRQRPLDVPQTAPKTKPGSDVLSRETLRLLVLATIAIGIILIGTVIINAHTSKLQYSINQLEKQNEIIQTEINLLNVKIGSNTSIQELETYATGELSMHYPEGNECIHLASMEAPSGLADMIKQKAYA